MYSLSNQPQTLLSIIKTSFIVFSKTFIKVLPFTLLMIFINFVDIFLLEPNSKDLANSAIHLLLTIAFLMVQLAFIYGVFSLVVEGKNLNISTLFKIGLKRLLPAIGLGLAYLLFLLPAIFAFGIGAVLGERWVYVSLIFVVPYCIFIILKLAFSMILISIPEKGVWQSIEESSDLVSGKLLKLGFYLLIPALVFSLLIGSVILLSPSLSNIPEYLLIGLVFVLPILSVVSIEFSYIYLIVIMHNFLLEKNKKKEIQEKNLDVKS